ncbi:MAG TPA: GAF domain-containing protein, partial [Nitrolancea sp.]|nr:GAF domain-containing protein [Nitrolancea sp.]
MQTPLVLKATTASDAGNVQTVNGDTLGVREPATAIERVEHGTIWVIADGVGNEVAGLQAGQLAAQMIIDTYWSSAVPDRAARLRTAVERANALLYERNQSGNSVEGTPSGIVGATVIAAVIAEGRLVLAHVGRSRAYLYHANALSRLTDDHSWVAEQVRAGLLSPEEAVNHPRQNFITRCLGVKATVQIDLIKRDLVQADVVLLCSDGLYRDLDDANIAQIIQRYGSDSAPILVNDAKRNGGYDNITAVTVAGEVVSIRETPTLERVARIARLGRELATSLDLDETLASVLRQLLQISGGERAAVLIREANGQLSPRIVHNMDVVGDLHSRTVAGEAMRDRRPILIANMLDDSRFNSVESIVAMAIRSILCVPMIVKEDVVGVLYVDSS